jgi:RNA polymerase sigma-70 factor (ECF subfamily)
VAALAGRRPRRAAQRRGVPRHDHDASRRRPAALGACATRDVRRDLAAGPALRELLVADAIQYSDGGGRPAVARTPIHGAEKIARFYANVRRAGSMPADLVPSFVLVNGELGVRFVSPASGPYAITLLEIADGRIQAIRNFVNPERFARL